MTNVLKNNAASDAVAKLYLNEDLADVHFQFNVDDDVQLVPANKNILAALSPVFYTMFYGSLKEGNVVQIVDANADAFKEFLQFFYLGEVTLSMENIETVVRLADKYDVLECVKACATFLQAQLTLINMCWGYQLAVNLKNERIIAFCEDKIVRSPEEIFVTDGFQQCDQSILKRILGLNLSCNEARVFEACLAWAKYACKRDDLDETKAENLRTQLNDCWKLIRFGAMTSDEFGKYYVSNKNLFTLEEFEDIMLSLTLTEYKPKIFNRSLRNETSWCSRESTNSSRRFVESTEVIWFTSNQTTVLGGFYSSETYNAPSKFLGCTVNVTVAEINSNSSKMVLYEGESKTWDKFRLKVVLSQPILIKPHTMYEIRVTVPIISEARGPIYYGTWKTTIELKNGLTIQFHRNPFHTSYDTSSSGWIEHFGLKY